MLHKNLNKKGQGLSLNIIIIAVIALLVLVVVIWIFTGKVGIFTKGVDSCESKGGVCPLDKYNCEGYGPMIGKVDDKTITCNNNGDETPNQGVGIDGVVCCLKLG